MRNILLAVLLVLAFLPLRDALAKKEAPVIELHTNKGLIVVELNPEKAPITSENFKKYVEDGFYDGTIFHRVIKGFMIQGGGMTSDMQEKETRESIQNEADNGLANNKYTIAMARTMDPHSASSQFYINSVNNGNLNHKRKDVNGWGYCVFGKVIEGKEVVDAIEQVDTTSKAGHQNVPVEPVVIEKAVIRQ